MEDLLQRLLSRLHLLEAVTLAVLLKRKVSSMLFLLVSVTTKSLLLKPFAVQLVLA